MGDTWRGYQGETDGRVLRPHRIPGCESGTCIYPFPLTLPSSTDRWGVGSSCPSVFPSFLKYWVFSLSVKDLLESHRLKASKRNQHCLCAAPCLPACRANPLVPPPPPLCLRLPARLFLPPPPFRGCVCSETLKNP